MAVQLPRAVRDYGALVVFICGGHLYAWYMLCLVVPYYYHQVSLPRVAYLHYVFGILVYINVFVNLYKMRRSNIKADKILSNSQVSGDKIIPSSDEPKNCDKCIGVFPPRSHHCKVCDFCVTRRDHHCWFAACCVGLQNHRYYIIVIVWVFVCAIYGNIYNWQYVGDQMGGHTIGTWLCIFAPHMAAVLGQFTWNQLFVAFMTFNSYFFMILVFILLREQTACILKGQTKFERKKGLGLTYSRGWRRNIVEVLGDKWYIMWIWPGITSTLPTDFTTNSSQNKRE